MSLFAKNLELGILFNHFERQGYELLFVGGACRDYILNTDSKDIDLATNVCPQEIIWLLEDLHLPVVPIGMEFGTIGTLIQGKQIEITTYRSAESYTKGSRKPKVVWGKTIEEDLSRRDLTINSFAMNRDGDIIDPFKGLNDLRNRLIRTPIDPNISFKDDPLRMLRVFRFAGRLNGYIELQTWRAIEKNKELLLTLSAERIFEEFTKILMLPVPSFQLREISIAHVFEVLFPELEQCLLFRQPQGKYHSKLLWEHIMSVVDNTPADPVLRWAALMHDIGKPETYTEDDNGIHFYQHEQLGEEIWRNIATRYKISNEFTESVALLIKEHLAPSLLSDGFDLSKETLPHKKDKGIRRFIRRMKDKKHLGWIYLLSRADITSHKEETVKAKIKKLDLLFARVEELINQQDIQQLKLPTGTGNKIMEATGMKPGPELGKLMKYLEQGVIDGKLPVDSDFGQIAKDILKDIERETNA